MLKQLVRILFIAVLFSFIFPKVVPGVQFHGQFWPDALIYATVFVVVGFVFEVLIGIASQALTILTLGFGAVLVVLVLFLGFWLIPAAEFQIFAYYFPERFSVDTWWSAIFAGFFLMVVNLVTRIGKKDND